MRHRDKIDLQEDDVVFLCEGRDDCAVLSHLTKEWGRQPKIGTRDDSAGGTGWQEEFKALGQQAFMRRIKAIGFLFDAEPSREARIKELQEWYAAANLIFPARESELTPTVRETGVAVSTAFLLVPPNGGDGCLEDLFLPQIRESPIAPCIDALVECYAKSQQPSKESDAKLRLRTFIAHKNAYNTGLQVALRDGHLRCDTREFGPIAAFLALFNRAGS